VASTPSRCWGGSRPPDGRPSDVGGGARGRDVGETSAPSPLAMPMPAPETTVVPGCRPDRWSTFPAHRLAALVGAGEVSAVEVARAHLARVAEAEPWTRALVRVDPEDVLAQASGIDVRRSAGRSTGALAGVPVVLKDNIDVRGQVTTSGSKAHRPPARTDSEVTRRLRRAGAVVLGRANMDELALGASTQTSAFNRSHHPHHPGAARVAAAAGRLPRWPRTRPPCRSAPTPAARSGSPRRSAGSSAWLRHQDSCRCGA
jgi:Asp-tRNA(Asn)/Glu-tRNA(Gln) amidotransferase A subunit family amidase